MVVGVVGRVAGRVVVGHEGKVVVGRVVVALGGKVAEGKVVEAAHRDLVVEAAHKYLAAARRVVEVPAVLQVVSQISRSGSSLLLVGLQQCQPAEIRTSCIIDVFMRRLCQFADKLVYHVCFNGCVEVRTVAT